MRRHPAARILPGVIVLTLAAPLSAQQPEPVPVSTVITAFLADSGIRTTGLPWATGAGLPVRWDTPAPVANPDPFARQRGITHAREGTFLGTLGDSVTLPMRITVTGTQAAVAGMTILMDSLLVDRPGGGGFFVQRAMVEEALRHDGLTLQPIKCSRDTEGASYGNLVDAVKAPGKTASGLWWMWQSPQQVPTLMLALLYRRADMAQVECIGG